MKLKAYYEYYIGLTTGVLCMSSRFLQQQLKSEPQQDNTHQYTNSAVGSISKSTLHRE